MNFTVKNVTPILTNAGICVRCMYPRHVDGNNLGPSYIMSLGEHTGGKLWTADQGEIDCHKKWAKFDGNPPYTSSRGVFTMQQPMGPIIYSAVTLACRESLISIPRVAHDATPALPIAYSTVI